jgi:hypothetical protein
VIQVEWAFLCDYAFLDAGRKMCLIGLFDTLYAAKVPVTHPHAALAMRISGPAGSKVPIRVDVCRPTGSVLARIGGEIGIGQPPPDSGGVAPGGEFHFNFANLLLPDYGAYSIDIFIAEEPARTVRFRVTTPPQSGNPN